MGCACMHVLWVLIASQLVMNQGRAGVTTRAQVYGVYLSEQQCKRSEGIPKLFGGAAHGTVRCVEVLRMGPAYWAPAK